MCDDSPVPGTWESKEGVQTFRGGAPKSGDYFILVGPDATSDCLQKLTTTGDLHGRWNPETFGSEPKALKSIRVTAKLEGGGKPLPDMYVLELSRVELKEQSEPDDDILEDNDEGNGEFQLEAVAALTARPPEGTTPKGADALPGLSKVVKAATYPSVGGHFSLPTAPDGSIVGYPNLPIASFTVDELRAHDRLGAAFRVWEDDDSNGWATLKQLLQVLSEMAKTIVAAVQMDSGGFLSGMKDYITAIVNIAPPEDEDEVMGYPGFYTEKEWEFYGALVPDPNAGYEISSPAPPEKKPDKQPQQLGSRQVFVEVQRPVVGGSGVTVVNQPVAWVTCPSVPLQGDEAVKLTLRFRKAQALWSWAAVQLLDFTVTTDLDSGDDELPPMEIRIPGKFGTAEGFNWTIWGNESEELGTREPRLYWFVEAGKPFQVQQATPPAYKQEGAVLRPLYGQMPESPLPYTYYELCLRDIDPGYDDLVGILSYTFYHDDIRKQALAAPGQTVYPEGNGRPDADRAIYRKEGPFYSGEFWLHRLGNYLGEVHLKVWVYVWVG